MVVVCRVCVDDEVGEADELVVWGAVRSIHVYDFDNTLFMSPLPNPKLWNGPTLVALGHQEMFVSGGMKGFTFSPEDGGEEQVAKEGWR